jgi:hypothetical protein
MPRALGLGGRGYRRRLAGSRHGGQNLQQSSSEKIMDYQLPPQIVGNWCLALEQMREETTYPFKRCKVGDSNWDIIVRSDGFDAQATACKLRNARVRTSDNVWTYTFDCQGEGLSWQEDDEIRIGKAGWTMKATIRDARKVTDPIRYCLVVGCEP